MPVINSDNRDAWQALANDVEEDRPSPGKRVEIVGGRKHKGKTGTIVRHERNKFTNEAFRYGGEAAHHLRDMMGRDGFRVQVRTDEGETFWCDADYTKVIDDETRAR